MCQNDTLCKTEGVLGIVLIKIMDEPSIFEVVIMEESRGKVERLVEKADTIRSRLVFDRTKLRPTSIAKEIPKFWMNIGQPRDITRLRLYLVSLGQVLNAMGSSQERVDTWERCSLVR
ncbi:hypothetical protein ARALYDRAFT_906987 [Arabidopsis lyrata subsp. lyrata]|uniref:Uncharacterized protein n=1 Tax=Arabidopsis lyrata subsp. lyrata TaxID=81972 RepID=D7LV63_ARALL|nr:hypothetical protein ARALYDRAFT_906987 [Arabidopsis lyrata subsp. lyrata]